MLVNQLPSPAPGVTRCNSLGLSGTVLAVANQAAKAGGTLAGMWVLDVSSFDRVTDRAFARRPQAVVLRHLGPAVARRAQPVVRGRRVRAPHHGHARLHAHQRAGRSDLGDRRSARPPPARGRWGAGGCPGTRTGRSLPARLPAEAARTVRRRLPPAPDRDLARPRRPRLRRLHRRRRDDLRRRGSRAGAQRARRRATRRASSGRCSFIRRSRRGRTRSSRCFRASWRGLPTRT